MKRWLWVLVVPYVVTVSTEHYTTEKKYYEIKLSSTSDSKFSCEEKSKDFCFDLAESLNAAHERRATKQERNFRDYEEKVPSTNPATGQDSFIRMAPIDPGIFPGYKSACGQDDCGKDHD